MNQKGGPKQFFDHSLQTTLPTLINQESVTENQNIEKDHDVYLNFRKEIKAMFSDITESTIYLLHKKFCDSQNLLQDATNAYLDNSGNFPDHESAVKAHAQAESYKLKFQQIQNKKNADEEKRMNYEYVSRKRGVDSIVSGSNTSKYFNKSAKNKVSSIVPKRRNTVRSVIGDNHKPVNEKNDSNIENIQEAAIKEEKKYWKKYIGTMNMSCWCTRSVYSLNSVYLENRLIFTKPSGSDVVYVSHKPENGHHRRELGRLAEETAEFIGPLVDEGAVQFESKLFFVEDQRLSTGDTFVIRVDCFLSEKIFENQDANDDIDEDWEVEHLKIMKGSNGNVEAGTRLKSCILKLFQKLNLKSVQEIENNQKLVDLSNDDYDEGSEFQELHNNAQVSEPFVSDDMDVDESEEDSETANDNRLTMNQVKDLYRSTELNNLQQSLPESTPNSFNIELRRYQKQGLTWMLQREKEYDLIGLNNDNFSAEEKDNVVQQLKSLANSLNPLWKEYTWPNLPERLQSLELPPNCADGFYLNLYKGNCTMIKPVIKSTCKGGILADEMGLGKTITTLSLVLSSPKDLDYESLDTNDINKIKDYASGTTLIIVPMALLTQWEKEFLKIAKDPEKNRCFIYYGQDTLGNLKHLLCGPNPPVVVLTTYGMIQSEWSKMNRSETFNKNCGLFSIKFLRIILDEGHNIRNRMTKTAKAVYALKADRRWVLTGTPIINRLEDLFSLVHFLGLKPWSYHSLWKHCISVPFDTGKDLGVAVDLLKSILDPILLRRTKNQKDSNGDYLVILPPKEVVIEKLKFNKKEDAIYTWLKEKAVNSFNENFKSGMVFKNYSSILTQLLRLRQVCCHVDLIKTNEDISDVFDRAPSSLDQKENQEQRLTQTQPKLSTKADDEMLSIVTMIETNEKQQRIPFEEMKLLKEEIYEQYPNFERTECSICTDTVNIDTCIITECKHCFCLSCLTEHFEFQLKHNKTNSGQNDQNEDSNGELGNTFNLQAEEVFCPMCRNKINKNRLFRTVRKNNPNAVNMVNVDSSKALMTQISTSDAEISREYFVRPFNPNGQSSKINALLIHLEQIKQESPGEHVIVFSQFTSFLDIIGNELEKYTGEFEVLRFDGRLNLEQRQRVLNDFEKKIPEGEQKICILLLSLKAGGVGLNLTVASRAFLMDPHWNNAIEFQAIDRIHRVGQMKNVKVVRFIVDGSIEERMLAIQEKKNQLGEALTMTDEERKKKRLEELQSLFQE